MNFDSIFKNTFTTLFSLFAGTLLIGCGPDLPQGEGGSAKQIENLVGGIRTLDRDEKMSSEEANGIQTACADLERKYGEFRTVEDLRQKLQYTSATKECGVDEFSEQPAYFVSIKTVSGRYAYQAEAGTVPPFTYVVTHQDDMMGKVCDHVKAAVAQEQLPSRTMFMAGDPVWISAYSENSSRCEDDSNCVYLETGIPVSGSNSRYRMKDVQFFAVNNGGDNALYRGFVVQRSQINLCGESSENTYTRQLSFITLQD